MEISDKAAASAAAPAAAAGIGHNKPPTIPELFQQEQKPLLAEVEALAQRAKAAWAKLTADKKVANDNDRDEWISLGAESIKLNKKIDEARRAAVEPLNEQIAEWNGLFGTNTPKDGSLRARTARIHGSADDLVTAYRDAQRKAAQALAAAEAEAARKEAEKKAAKAAKLGEDDTSIKAEVARNEAAAAAHRAASLGDQALGAGKGPVRTAGGTASSTVVIDFRITNVEEIDLGALRQHFKLEWLESAIRGHINAHKRLSRDMVPPMKGVEFFDRSKTNFRSK